MALRKTNMYKEIKWFLDIDWVGVVEINPQGRQGPDYLNNQCRDSDVLTMARVFPMFQ